MKNRCRIVLAVLLALVACWSTLGCQSAIVTAYYLFKGTDDDADFNGLVDKKVVVVCRPLVQLQYWNANVAQDISREVSQLLKDKLDKKIKMVDQRKLAKWIDENTWEQYVEVGRAMKADMVVGIDLEGFNIFQGQTLYQGNANAVVHVVDCKAGGKEVFARTMPPIIYPPNTGIPTSERQETAFRREFVQVLAERVARHFYSHDPNADVAEDAASLQH